ncbi:MAG: RnfABCDGE type electron transport complex subunit D [Ignavibacteria bacterium]|nr:RnfABCDGE type electron transport complex subunit D [Ignavibacteria bacterium]
MEFNSNTNHRLVIASSPHLHSRWSTKQAMWLVVLALLPSLIASVIFFGVYQLLIVTTSVFFSVLTETLIKKIRKKKISIADGSAIITGLLLGLILPPNFSITSTAIGAVFSIAIGKEIFGGLGFNIFNPALVGRAFLQAAFPVAMTTWQKPYYAVDTITSATPLASFKFDKAVTEIQPLILGNIGGSIGETSAVAIIIGGVFLIGIGIVNWRIPVSMIIGIMLISAIFWLVDPLKYASPLFHLFAGGYLFGVFFMATDWVTSPITAKGMWIFGIGIALIVVVIRTFGGLPEGVMYSILIMNAIVPIINRLTTPKIFGADK